MSTCVIILVQFQIFEKHIKIQYPKYIILTYVTRPGQINMFKKHSSTERENLKRVFDLQTNALITDFKYNHNGTKVAAADSEGNVYIYQRTNENFVKQAHFKADDAAIWKLSWADPSFGELIAIGSFKKKVGVFQNKNNKWTQIARHLNHEGSVNHVQWAPAAYGLKLYSAGSDGAVCIFQIRKSNWQMTGFSINENSIHSLSIKPIPLNEENRGLQNLYPTIATISKDLLIRIWRHSSQAKHLNLPNIQNYTEGAYLQVMSVKPHKELTRTILFQPIWSEDDDFPSYSILSGSQDGNVKLTLFQRDQQINQYTIHQGQSPVVNLSQSLTGKYLLVGVASHKQQTAVLYLQKQKGDWQVVEHQ